MTTIRHLRYCQNATHPQFDLRRLKISKSIFKKIYFSDRVKSPLMKSYLKGTNRLLNLQLTLDNCSSLANLLNIEVRRYDVREIIWVVYHVIRFRIVRLKFL